MFSTVYILTLQSKIFIWPSTTLHYIKADKIHTNSCCVWPVPSTGSPLPSSLWSTNCAVETGSGSDSVHRQLVGRIRQSSVLIWTVWQVSYRSGLLSRQWTGGVWLSLSDCLLKSVGDGSISNLLFMTRLSLLACSKCNLFTQFQLRQFHKIWNPMRPNVTQQSTL